MSYILDALRRAEAEREQGGVPGLHAQAAGRVLDPEGRPAAGQARWMAPALVVLVIAVGVLALRPWAADPPGAVAPSVPVAAATSPAAVVPAAPAAVVGTDSPSVATAPLSPLPAAEPAPAAPGSRAVPPSLADAPGRRAPAPTAAVATVAAAAKRRPADAPASAANAESKVYAQADLPPEIRQQLPALSIGGSIYSASPSSRFVIVNGQLLHEGDTVAPGLVLQEIRLKSAVLAFRGYRYGITY